MADKNSKRILASRYIAEILQFMIGRPKGYSTDDMLYLIRTWGKAGSNIDTAGDPQFYGANFWKYMKNSVLRDYNFTSTTKLSARPAGEEDTKPSLTFRQSLTFLANEIYKNNPIALASSLNYAHMEFCYFVGAFRLKLAQTDAEAGKQFRQSLAHLRLQHTP